MTKHVRYRTSRSPGNEGFTLVEAVISTVLIAVMLVAALSAVGASRSIQQQVALSHRGRLLAESLMAEIVQQAYEDPNESVVFGLEATESAGARGSFDDVDDYDGWSASPPVSKDGTVLADAGDWKRTVTVEWVDSADPTLVQAQETGAKRITVTASCNDVPCATLVSVRTAHQ
jgi:type II secretory pathway pseudopilin PulG